MSGETISNVEPSAPRFSARYSFLSRNVPSSRKTCIRLFTRSPTYTKPSFEMWMPCTRSNRGEPGPSERGYAARYRQALFRRRPGGAYKHRSRHRTLSPACSRSHRPRTLRCRKPLRLRDAPYFRYRCCRRSYRDGRFAAEISRPLVNFRICALFIAVASDPNVVFGIDENSVLDYRAIRSLARSSRLTGAARGLRHIVAGLIELNHCARGNAAICPCRTRRSDRALPWCQADAVPICGRANSTDVPELAQHPLFGSGFGQTWDPVRT